MRNTLFVFIYFIVTIISAQNRSVFNVEDAVSLAFESQKIELHPQGFLLSDEKGNLFLVDSLGKIQQDYSQNQQSEITDFKSNHKLSSFVFYEDLQKMITLNRFFAPIQALDFEHLELGYISYATPSADRQIWLLDNSSFSVKKLNLFTQEIQEIFTLDLILGNEDLDIVQMREYQNLLFLCDPNQGVLIFDNLGNHQKTIPLQNISSLHFYKNQFYFLDKNNVIFYDFYQDKEQIHQIDYQFLIKDLILINNKIFAICKNQLLRFSRH